SKAFSQNRLRRFSKKLTVTTSRDSHYFVMVVTNLRETEASDARVLNSVTTTGTSIWGLVVFVRAVSFSPVKGVALKTARLASEGLLSNRFVDLHSTRTPLARSTLCGM
ncbi:MAG: hypothetical protein AB8B91_14285, partial [Rubripirellula sp.]